MKHVSLFCFVLIGFFCGSPSTAHATSLNLLETGGNYGVFDQWSLVVRFGGIEMTDPLDPGYHWVDNSKSTTLFDLVLVPNDAGNQYVVDTGPSFESAVNTLTNGQEEMITFDWGFVGRPRSETWRPESYFATSVDYQGRTIDRISIFLNTLTISSPGTNPNRDGKWTDVMFDADFQIDSAPSPVPEPSTILLLASGLVGILGFRKSPEKEGA